MQTPRTRDALPNALYYHDCGLQTLPLPYGSKRPAHGDSWAALQQKRLSRSEVNRRFAGDDQNIALMFGRVSGNLFGKDCDNPRTYHDTLCQVLGSGIKTWITRRGENGSPHDGGGTFWFRAPCPVSYVDGDGWHVLGEGHYALAPFSMHPGRTHYFPADGYAHEIFTLPTLTALPGVTLTPALHWRKPSRWAWRLLRGDPEAVGVYNSRSEAECALVASLVNSGFDLDGIERLVMSSKNPGPGKFRELWLVGDPANSVKPSLDNARRWLRLTYEKALQFVRDNPFPARDLACALAEWANTRPWEGRTGTYDHALYNAHVMAVLRCGRNPYQVSTRSLAELAGVGRSAAQRATWRLVEQKLLRRRGSSCASVAQTYEMLEPDDLEDVQNGTYTHMGGTVYGSFCTQAGDAFRWRALNKTGAELFAVLREGLPVSVGDLVDATGRHRTTVTRRLSKMAQYGLVEEFGGSEWVLTPDAEIRLHQVAELCGTLGDGAAQRARHEEESADAWGRYQAWRAGPGKPTLSPRERAAGVRATRTRTRAEREGGDG